MTSSLITTKIYKRAEQHVKSFCNRSGITDHDAIEDMMGVMHEALIKAEDTFDASRDGAASFQTWMHTIVEQELATSAMRGTHDLVPRPEHVAKKWATIHRHRTNMTAQLGRTPTPAEVAESLKMPIAEYFAIRDVSEGVEYYSLNSDEHYDEDYVVCDEPDDWSVESSEEQAFYAAHALTPEAVADALEMMDDLEGAVERLTPFESQVIRLLYLTKSGAPVSQEAIAAELQCSQSSVSRARLTGTTKLRMFLRLGEDV